MAIEESTTTNVQLIEALRETRVRTLQLVDDLNDEQLIGPRLPILNPLRWEIAHLAWFQEFWVLRHLGGQPPILKNGDELYDSGRVAHDTRWDLPLLERNETLGYMERVLDRVIEQVSNESRSLKDAEGYDQEYFLNLVLLHEQMHDEAITYTRQTLSYPAQTIAVNNKVSFADKSAAPGQISDDPTRDAEIPDSKFILGSTHEERFIFDNEQLAHEIEIAPFAISKTTVTNGEFRSFVEDSGYNRSELWTAEGWRWRTSAGAEHPVYWRREGNDRWLRRHFDEWIAFDECLPVIHVNWHEAEAYCRWDGGSRWDHAFLRSGNREMEQLSSSTTDVGRIPYDICYLHSEPAVS
jgi:iron(II)-dependent oxidoreductase